MMKCISIRLFVVSALLLIAASAFSQADNPTLLKVGDEAPQLEMKSLDGNILKLSDYKGKYVVIDFWASWCGDCRREMPFLIDLYNEIKDKNISFFGVSFDYDRARLDQAIEKYQIPWPQVTEMKKWKETEINKIYKINWIPTFFLISPEGKILGYYVTVKDLRTAIEKIAL